MSPSQPSSGGALASGISIAKVVWTQGVAIENKPGVTEAEILSTGFALRADKTPTGTTPPVTALAVTAGDNAGELDAHWDPVPKVKTYEVQTSPDPMTADSWTSQTPVSKSKTAVFGLPSGTRVWVRVRAITAAGPGTARLDVSLTGPGIQGSAGQSFALGINPGTGALVRRNQRAAS